MEKQRRWALNNVLSLPRIAKLVVRYGPLTLHHANFLCRYVKWPGGAAPKQAWGEEGRREEEEFYSCFLI